METPTITVTNIQPGMVLDFQNTLARSVSDTPIYLGEAEIVSIQAPETSTGYFVLGVSPEDGSYPELYVSAYPWQTYPIAG